MQRGTTQTLTFTLPEEIDIAELYITFNQNKGTVLEKSKSAGENRYTDICGADDYAGYRLYSSESGHGK